MFFPFLAGGSSSPHALVKVGKAASIETDFFIWVTGTTHKFIELFYMFGVTIKDIGIAAAKLFVETLRFNKNNGC